MRLTASFEVPLPPDEAFEVLQDIERVAPFFPGARVDAASGEEFSGTVRVKLGPMMVDYRGSARFLERDESARRVVIEASGREQRGAGTARARAQMSVAPSGGGTAVSVVVELEVTGRPAQLGQSLMQDVAERVVAEFASRMSAELSSRAGLFVDAPAAGGGGDRRGGAADPSTAPGAAGGSQPGPGAAAVARGRSARGATGSGGQAGDALDLGRVAGPALLRRAAVPALAMLAALLGALIGGWMLRRAGRAEGGAERVAAPGKQAVPARCGRR